MVQDTVCVCVCACVSARKVFFMYCQTKVGNLKLRAEVDCNNTLYGPKWKAVVVVIPRAKIWSTQDLQTRDDVMVLGGGDFKAPHWNCERG